MSALQATFQRKLLEADNNPEDVYTYDDMITTYNLKQRMPMRHINARQKSKSTWLHEGDTKFFFARMNLRRYRNIIKALFDEKGELIFDN